MTSAIATRTGALIHLHGADGDQLITTQPGQDAAHWAEVINAKCGPGEWAAVPPTGSDWERADWDALAHRAGVA